MTHATSHACCDDLRAIPLNDDEGETMALRTHLSALWSWIKQAYRIAHQRHHLAQLGADQLDDIGLSPEAAKREANRPFWDF